MLAARSIPASRFVRGALTYVLSPIVSAAVGVALATAIVKTASAATVEKPRVGIAPVVSESGQLSPDMLRMIERLQKAPVNDVRDDSRPEALGTPDALAPGVGLPIAIARLENLQKTATGAQSAAIANALIELRLAQSTLHAGSGAYQYQFNVDYFRVTYQHVKNAQAQLKLAGSVPALADIQRNLTLIAQRSAKGILETARRAGVSADRLASAQLSFQRGQAALSALAYPVATGHFGDALGFAANTITFDVGLFEQNIIDAVDDQTVGYAFSITFNGQTYNGGHAGGLARTAYDMPVTLQSPNKDMHVASVSKTLTTIVTLHVLDALGLTPDEKVAPYLPSDWTLGTGVSDLSFKDFMTHETGFGQWGELGVSGSSYDSLRTLIGKNVGDHDFDYDNDNFGLLRVAVAGLLGIDPVDYGEFSPDSLTASAFLLEAQFLYGSIGVSVDCKATDPNPTIQYRFPDPGASGYEEPDRSLSCGGFGWMINANELAGVMSTLRNTEQLMSSQMREQMQDDFLGFMNPTNGYGSPNGDFGVYFTHGGDWYHSSGQLHSCFMIFPIVVEASLLINSERGAMAYQCDVLRDAFDNAWVP